MQLLNGTRPGRVAAALCLLTANLLATGGAEAQSQPRPGSTDGAGTDVANVYDQPVNDLDSLVVDGGVLYYKEQGGRVQAVEPTVSVVRTLQSGNVISGRLVFDALSGASPNGATPWTGPQTFVAPIKDQHSATGASGTVVTNPVTGKPERVYTTPAGKLPLDQAFRDHRVALDLGYGWALAPAWRLNLGADASIEEDYKSFSGRVSVAHPLNNGATTLSLGGNFEYDKVEPYHGIPVALASMNGTDTGRNDDRKVFTVLAGVTQILRPNWLVQLNYSYTNSNGYQTDPYRILSVVDQNSGAPLDYLYEARPRKRDRHAVYAASKLALGSFVTDVSARYYHDTWGIDAITVELAEHVPIARPAYIEPRVRFYHQTRADFFTYFLTQGDVLPRYASADSRLDGFNAWTFGATAGYELRPGLELYLNGDVYRTSKSGSYGPRPGALASYDLYAGADSFNILAGVKVKF
jgi:opacity protein-like surface antigen